MAELATPLSMSQDPLIVTLRARTPSGIANSTSAPKLSDSPERRALNNDCGHPLGASGYPGTAIDGTGRAKNTGERFDLPAQSPFPPELTALCLALIGPVVCVFSMWVLAR